MARPVSDAQVRALIPSTTIADLSPFISVAHSLTNRLAASPCGSGLSESDLELIETWLAAHFAAVTDPTVAIVQQQVEGSSVTVSRGNVNSMEGIMSTQFGQMANTLSGGCLYEITKPQTSLAFF